MANPLNRWPRKDVKHTWGNPPDEQRKSFEALKHSLVEPTFFTLQISNKLFLPDMDSSAYKLGVTLL